MTARLAACAIGLLLSTTVVRPATGQFDAFVDGSYSGRPGALIEGTATFSTIGEALKTVPEANDQPFKIFIRNGRYREKLVVDRPFVHLVGESRDGTVLTFDASSDTPGPDGLPVGTYGSFTIQIAAPDFQAENLTIENAFDYASNAAKEEDDPTKVHNPQGVAVMTTGSSDRTVFRNCVITGFQDTLFVDAGRHYFQHCRILGHVDFIFGAGQAVFEESEIVSRPRPGKNPSGYVTAPSTHVSMPFGFLFVDSKLLRESPDVPAGSVRLGRPWHPGADSTANGSAIFVHCFLDEHIGPEGYARISGRNAAGERIWFEVGPESRFFEFESYGPGAIASPSRPRLSEAAARWYTPERVLAGWKP